MEKTEQFDNLKQNYKPKEGYQINAKISDISGKFVAFVYKQVPVNRFRKDDYADTAVASVITDSFAEYFKFLSPYLRQK